MPPSMFFKILSDDTRLTCLLLLAEEGELCVCELTEALNEIQPKISRHLSRLRHHNILLDKREGQWVFYQLNPSLQSWQKDLLHTVAKKHMEYISAAKQRLSKMHGRPERASKCCT